jgi:hypothetical protein
MGRPWISIPYLLFALIILVCAILPPPKSLRDARREIAARKLST